MCNSHIVYFLIQQFINTTINVINIVVCYIWTFRVNLESSSQQKYVFFLVLYFASLWHNAHQTSIVSQIIIQYTLNIYNDICQLYINKTGETKISKNIYEFT